VWFPFHRWVVVLRRPLFHLWVDYWAVHWVGVAVASFQYRQRVRRRYWAGLFQPV
jgi:hypothetical protein